MLFSRVLIVCFHKIARGNQAVADPIFPRRDVVNPKDRAPTYYLANFFTENPRIFVALSIKVLASMN